MDGNILYLRPLDKPMDEPKAPEVSAIETPKREGFVVVEGGGILADFFVNQDSWMFHSAQAE